VSRVDGAVGDQTARRIVQHSEVLAGGRRPETEQTGRGGARFHVEFARGDTARRLTQRLDQAIDGVPA